MITIAFDVDGCLIDENDKPTGVVNILDSLLLHTDAKIIIWSGGGEEYARLWGQRLRSLSKGFDNRIAFQAKNSAMKPDITFDDQDVNLGKINIQVK